MTHSIRRVALAASFVTVFAAAAVSTQAPAPAGGTEANKQLVRDFFSFTGSREDRAARFMTDDYVQHNPRFLRMDQFTNAHGRDAWVSAQAEGTRRGIRLTEAGIPLRQPALIVSEGDAVIAIYKGALPDPDDPSKTYDAFGFEAFRVRDGKFIEHWDQVRLTQKWMESR